MILIIAPFLFDRNDHVRYYAAEALMNLGYQESIPILESALPVIGLTEISRSPTTKGIQGVEFMLKKAINVLKNK